MPKLTDYIVESLLPTANPPDIFPEGLLAGDRAPRLQRFESPVQQHIFGWMTAFQAIAERRRLDRVYPGFQYTTYGFVPVSSGAELLGKIRTVEDYVFGIAVELEPTGDTPSQSFDQVIEGDLIIPCVFNHRRIELDVANPIAPNGTGACWARSNKPSITPASDGVLTAEHVVAGMPLTSSVAMSGSGSWYLGDRGSCKIDAALIVQAGCIPSSAARLGVEYNPLDNTNVEILGAATGKAINARITHTVIHPTYMSARHPMRVFLDSCGIPGDSGALVMDQATRQGIGIYMGRDPVPPSLGAPPVYEGVAQALSQAKHTLQVDLFL